MRLDGAAQVAQIVLAASALVAVMVATAQVLSARSATKQTLTYNYMERFNSPELLPFHQKTADLFRSRTPADEGERYADFLKWDQKDKLAVLVVPNFFEEVAGMYNHGLLDRNVAKVYFGELGQDLWASGSWLIERWRKTDAGYFEEWEKMLRDMGYLK